MAIVSVAEFDIDANTCIPISECITMHDKSSHDHVLHLIAVVYCIFCHVGKVAVKNRTCLECSNSMHLQYHTSSGQELHFLHLLPPHPLLHHWALA